MIIEIITPAGAGSRAGNRHTATRWAGLLRELGHDVAVSTCWSGRPAEMMIALHARRSHESAKQFRTTNPASALVIVLTGTDLYRDIRTDRDAQDSLSIADRLVVLQEMGGFALHASLRAKTRVIYQSARSRAPAQAPTGIFRIAVVGHLRGEKDPFRAAIALRSMTDLSNMQVVQIGQALAPQFEARARRFMELDPRYRWIGSVPHWQALRWMARSHALVVSSRMEGGANVIAEAAVIGVPVIASQVPGNVGMLGRNYPGYFRPGDHQDLARQLRRAATSDKYYAQLRRMLSARRRRFLPDAERIALRQLVAEFSPRPRSRR